MTLPDLKADIEALKRIAEAALRCLYLEAPESVVKDVGAKVEAVFAAQAAHIEALEAELASLRSEREGMREGLETLNGTVTNYIIALMEHGVERDVLIEARDSSNLPEALRRASALLHQGEGETP